MTDKNKTTKRHFSLSVDGALTNWKPSDWKAFSKYNGLTIMGLKTILEMAKYEGKKVIPMGDCDNFDSQKGCLGHG